MPYSWKGSKHLAKIIGSLYRRVYNYMYNHPCCEAGSVSAAMLVLNMEIWYPAEF